MDPEAQKLTPEDINFQAPQTGNSSESEPREVPRWLSRGIEGDRAIVKGIREELGDATSEILLSDVRRPEVDDLVQEFEVLNGELNQIDAEAINTGTANPRHREIMTRLGEIPGQIRAL